MNTSNRSAPAARSGRPGSQGGRHRGAGPHSRRHAAGREDRRQFAGSPHSPGAPG
ncbi:MAG: hypothetical protein MZV70_43915 [Desulfobacterales bacterium]|nr:hypothetical protein [Desulfobacterales bacterium]